MALGLDDKFIWQHSMTKVNNPDEDFFIIEIKEIEL